MIKERRFSDIFFCLFSEENIQIITEISENASKEYSIEKILENIIQIWNDLKFEITIHKPNVFKIKYEEFIWLLKHREIKEIIDQSRRYVIEIGHFKSRQITQKGMQNVL